MNKTKYMQTDSRWGGLGYPRKPYYLRNCGCGEVSIANVIIEMAAYSAYTPATIQPYCKQFADPHGNGTYWSGIPAMMKHYGMTEVKEHATMDKLWAELAKGDRVAIYLMGSRKGGSKGVHWTSGGHFVCSTAYEYKNGKHYVYVKDSYSNSSLRNGWISYEENMRNDVLKVWSGKLNGSPAPTPTPPAPGKLVVDGIGGLKTVNRLQEFLGVKQTDGITIRKDLQKYVPSLKAYDYGKSSPTVLMMQKWLGLSNPDGCWGPNTSKALQKKIGASVDGIFGVNSMKALQKYLNEHSKAEYPAAPKPAPTAPQTTTPQDKMLSYAKYLAGSAYHYVKYSLGKKAHECPICHNHPKGKYYGGNCIWLPFACWHHGAGIKCRCSCDAMTDQLYEKVVNSSDSTALKLVQDRIKVKEIKVLKSKGGLNTSQLKPGDIIAYFNGSNYVHTALYVGNGKIADCTSGRKDSIKYGVASYTKWKIKIAIRYTGK